MSAPPPYSAASAGAAYPRLDAGAGSAPPAYPPATFGGGGGGGGGGGVGSAGHSMGEAVDTTRPMRLHQDASSRVKFDHLADLYALIITLEHLELAYVRSTVKPSDYTAACARLLGQLKTQEQALQADRHIVDVNTFIKENGMLVPHAAEPIRTGVPSTARNPTSDDRSLNAVVAETVQYFITAMDGLKLDMRSVDEIQPLISDLMTSLNKCNFLGSSFEGKEKLNSWLVVFRGMRAHDTVDDDQHRQLAFDLDQAYSAFHGQLAHK